MPRSNRDIARETIARFREWIAKRDAVADWPSYIRAGKLNRSEIAIECGFGRAAWRQNSELGPALAELEIRLRAEGLLPASDADNPAVNDFAAAVRHATDPRDRRIETLEATIASLRAENAALRGRLKQIEFVTDELVPTGRRLQPGFL